MNLLWWAIIALVISVIAGVLGFTNVARGAAVVSRWLFAIFLIIFVVVLIAWLF